MSSSTLFRQILALPPSLRRRLYSSAASPEIYDVVCVGGGPAGLSFASALKSHPSTRRLRIALIDSQTLQPSPRPSDEAPYSNRCSSLTPSSVRFLKRIGAWTHIEEERTAPYHGMRVWDGVSGSKIDFDPRDGRESGLLNAVSQLVPGFGSGRAKGSGAQHDDGTVATMCENSNTTTALLRSLQEREDGDDLGVSMLDRTKVSSIDLGPEPKNDEALDLSQWPIVDTGSQRLAARLLVGADGANSPVRQFADIPSHGWDYGQHGVVATLQLDRPFSALDLRTAYQRFLPSGPIALLPLPGDQASLVWSTSVHYATKLKHLSTADFASVVNAAFRLLPVDITYMLDNPSPTLTTDIAWRESNTSSAQTGLPSSFPRITAVQAGSIASFPLRMRHASTYTGHRIALIGDAAHTIHPLAGQGLNLGLADAEALANRIAYGMEHGMDIGSCWCLDGYNSERWAANNAMIGVVDKLHKLYSASSGPVVWARSLGLDAVNALGPLKGALMAAAAGTR